MKPLCPPDIFHLRAAQGWVELGNHAEARAELNAIGPEFQSYPDVLEVRWHIDACARQWEAAVEAAAALIQVAPESPAGWIHRSFALHELKRTAEARDNLLRMVERFPENQTMRYNLACYECQLGRLDEAWAWLEKAFKLGDAKATTLMALEDADLKPLWKRLGAV